MPGTKKKISSKTIVSWEWEKRRIRKKIKVKSIEKKRGDTS